MEIEGGGARGFYFNSRGLPRLTFKGKFYDALSLAREVPQPFKNSVKIRFDLFLISFD